MTDPVLRLRPATRADAYALWIWANDPDTRAASWDRDVIAWQAHVAWFDRVLGDANHAVLVLEDVNECPFGTIRFDTKDGWREARLSYAIAPERRGQGLASMIVRLGVEWLWSGGRRATIRAVVSSPNARSLRVFRRLEWREEMSESECVFLRIP